MSTNSFLNSKPRKFKPTKINDFTVSVKQSVGDRHTDRHMKSDMPILFNSRHNYNNSKKQYQNQVN